MRAAQHIVQWTLGSLRVCKHFLQMIETVNAQLSGQFNIEISHAHSFWGLCTRLDAKLAVRTLCIYLNRLIGKPAFLQIKALAVPIQYKALKRLTTMCCKKEAGYFGAVNE